ncbi:MAG: carboxypeptidase-like regulatory domain-containing protein [Saprospiraceae bacterium]|nr:carboxypeptidase-like regulatory domain-containing protein [Saprospiraceae bacterium]
MLSFKNNISALVFCCVTVCLSAQNTELIQLSGMVMTDVDGQPRPLPFAEIGILNTNRGTYADSKGFFSLAVQRGDSIVFQYIGYKSAFFLVPDSLSSDRYTVFQILTKDTIFLPQTVVYPWPSKEYFRQEFLAMDVSDKLSEIAAAHLAQERIRGLMSSTPADGTETSSLYLSQQAQNYYYMGQLKPMNILSPLAWIEFFKAWQRGDFKRKK